MERSSEIVKCRNSLTSLNLGLNMEFLIHHGQMELTKKISTVDVIVTKVMEEDKKIELQDAVNMAI